MMIPRKIHHLKSKIALAAVMMISKSQRKRRIRIRRRAERAANKKMNSNRL